VHAPHARQFHHFYHSFFIITFPLTMARVSGGHVASPGPPHVVVPFIEIKCVFRLIPKEILKHIVSFGDVASNVLFASTSSSFREFVFTKCPCTWENIDFGKISKTQAENLTDADLHSLLTNVKAVQVTTTRSIMGCTSSIQGRGLSALAAWKRWNFAKQEKKWRPLVTLAWTTAPRTVVTGILSSMVPINENLRPFSRNGGLKLVKIRKQHYENRTFLSTLNDAVVR
jgi:hypothetical protein